MVVMSDDKLFVPTFNHPVFYRRIPTTIQKLLASRYSYSSLMTMLMLLLTINCDDSIHDTNLIFLSPLAVSYRGKWRIDAFGGC
jgi:hypothetical protein